MRTNCVNCGAAIDTEVTMSMLKHHIMPDIADLDALAEALAEALKDHLKWQESKQPKELT